MKKDLPELDLTKLATYDLIERPSKVDLSHQAKTWKPVSGFSGWLDSLPQVLAAQDLKELAGRIVKAYRADKRILLGMGGHVIKVGLSPLLIDLIERGIIGGLLVNGSCLVHDFELTLAGKTSEDVGQVLGEGAFGMSEQTGRMINEMINRGVAEGLGLGQAVGQGLLKLEHHQRSVLAAAARAGIPLCCCQALGTDIIHMHQAADGDLIGRGSLADFRLLSRLVADLSGGVYLNVGSAVLLPEVFLKAVSVARNLGHPVDDLTTAVMDFKVQYRPKVNVQQRPTSGKGRGYYLVGHHEIMFPLLYAAIIQELES